MRDPFARAMKSVLSTLGQDALLRGMPAGKVNIEHGVEVFEKNGDGEAMFARSVATIDKIYAPRRGDTLQILDTDGNETARYRVEGLFADNGFTVRHIVLPVAV
jgi:hypothetical protein